jgi:outer membrane protein assembly factor BamE (lipoprotein component of BamABCDE complex)
MKYMGYASYTRSTKFSAWSLDMDFKAIPFLAIVLFLGGCATAAQHRAAVQDNSSERVTVGTVQKEIRVGMSSAQVAEVLGSPNIVSTDEERREVWVYDKIATDKAYSSSQGGISALILGFGGNAAGGANAGYGASSGASSTSQRTLTIIIKFDKSGKVRDFAYHTSRF